MLALSGYNFNFYNILIFSGVVYGVVFCVAVWRIKLVPILQRILLVLTVITITSSNLQYWLIDVGVREKFGIHKVFHLQFELLIIQFFYLFVIVYIGIKIQKFLLYIIGLVFLIGLLYQYYSFVLLDDLDLRRKYNFIAEIFTILYALTFFILTFKKLITYRKQNKELAPNTKWLLSTLIFGTLVVVFWIVTTQIFHFQGRNLFSTYYPLWISMTLLVYFIGYRSFKELFIFYQRKEIRRKLINDRRMSKRTHRQNTNISLYEEIVDFIKLNKEYLNPNLSLQLVGDKFNVSSGYISQLFTKNSEESFTDFVNLLRINEAKMMLSTEEYSNYTIDAIGLESGFKTKSNFYNAFKRYVKITPSVFRKTKSVQNF